MSALIPHVKRMIFPHILETVSNFLLLLRGVETLGDCNPRRGCQCFVQNKDDFDGKIVGTCVDLEDCKEKCQKEGDER